MNVLVTGSANGLGAALLDELRQRGHAVGSLDIAWLEGPLLTEDGGWRWHFDVSDEGAWVGLTAELESIDWPVDVLINCAGIGSYGSISDLTTDDWRRQLDISLTGPWLSLKYVGPIMKDQGLILNIGSRRGLKAVAERTAYCAAKFGLRGLSLAAAAELEGSRRVSIVELDSMLTNFTGSLSDKQRRASEGERFLHPEEVASIIVDVVEGKRPFMTEWRLRATDREPRVEAVTEELW